MNLSQHFSYEEFCRSDTALRLGIENMPNPEQLANGTKAAVGMEKVRSVLGVDIFVHSWLRVEALERVLCAKDFAAWCVRHGKPADELSWVEYFRNKGHPKGYCIDFTAPAFGTPRQIVKVIKASGIKFDQLIEEGANAIGGGWVHVSFDERMRGEVLTATFKDGTPTYTTGLV